MSASTVSITANPTATRRRPVVAGEKKSGLDLVGIEASPTSGGGGGGAEMGCGKDLSHSIERSKREVVFQVKKSIPPISTTTTTTTKPHRSSTRKGGSSSKPRWLMVVSVFTKNLLLLLLLAGLIQVFRRLALNSPSSRTIVSSDNFEGQISELEEFIKKTTKLMQVQVDAVDRKIHKIGDNVVQLERELDKLGTKTDSLEKYLSEFSGNDWLSKGEFDKFFEDFKTRKGVNDGGEVSLDEVRAIAREIIQKEIEKHAADGLGRVDFALASGGAAVVKHSDAYRGGSKGSVWFPGTSRTGVHSYAEKMLTPSFGEPGQCFPLQGSSGFVQIKLRTAIIPEAITLEHVSKSVAYDRSSAPKHCRVSGWFRGHVTTDPSLDTEKRYFLTEFTYDLEKSNAQTFKVLDSAASNVVDTIRLDVTSNHGSTSHTCIYRLRVHGHEPESVLAVQS